MIKDPTRHLRRKLIEIEAEIASVSDRLVDLGWGSARGADNEELIRARDKLRHLRERHLKLALQIHDVDG